MSIPAPGPAVARPIELCLDSSVVCTLLLQEPGWRMILRAVQRPEVTVILPGPCLAETIRVTRRKGNKSSAKQLHAALLALGVRVEHPTDEDLVRTAELIEISDDNPGPPSPRSDHASTLSLGDALILAVTERLGAMVLTRDQYWKWMVDQELLRVRVVIS